MANKIIMEKLLLKDCLPEVLEEMKAAFEQKEMPKLLKHLETLEITEVCECGDASCGSFYTDHLRRDNIEVEGIRTESGFLVEVYNGRIHYVEVM
ncbi:MAG: hypothetical protein LPK03_07040, partial [Pontibacter sp.]|nr:hypothetical protein [Pontibacter sp.]